MYIKPRLPQDESFRIPDNYSGNAFTGDSTVPSAPIEPMPLLVPLEEASAQEKQEAPITVLPASRDTNDNQTKKGSTLAALLPPKLSSPHGGLLGDVGVEELLIIGILILLSQSEADDDILLLLMLLLFYK